ncbi:glycoside hydrolase family 78 protein [Sclerotinia borealis F-4128]|uniref:Glycoside hydrolase family 78 protein n=1 Tax=Sclerotinia borealis (strain F-4128) TaxID=1432307 RepID=W9CN85_SCLBF|nr:glycoside hydrolase family 78 protein [Sclerotinia borealis F-4128]
MVSSSFLFGGLSLAPLFLCIFVFSSVVESLPRSSTYQIQNQLLSKKQDSSSSPNWQKYVRATSSNIVVPQSVVTTSGKVTNPNALLQQGGQVTTLTRDSGSINIPSITLDFGQNTVGYLSINFAGALGTPGIRLAFSETLQYLSDTSDFSRSNQGDTITPGSDQIAVGSQNFTWTDVHGCQHGTQVCADGLHGFRYVRIYLDALAADSPYTAPYGTVAIDYLSLTFSGLRGTPDTFTGWFESSDESFNQWWYDGVYTNDVATDVFRLNSSDPRNAFSPTLDGKLVLLDGAKRDRDPYVGDIAVAGKTSFLSHNTPEASRNVLADLADHQRDDGWIPPASIGNYDLHLLDYPLWWIVCSHDLLMYTGDNNYIQKYYHTLINVLDKFYPSVTDSGTNLVWKGVGISGSYGDYAFLPRVGPVSYYSALYVLALENAAVIAKSQGQSSDASRWLSRAKVVSDALNSHNFDTSVGAFFDGTCGDIFCNTHPQDGNSISILAGVTNTSRSIGILNYLNSANSRFYGNSFYDNDVMSSGFSQRVYAFISFFEISARFKTNLVASAFDEIRRLYGWMATHDPKVTMWEGIGPNGSPYEQGFTSMAHGWSTGIVPALSNYVLGVTPTGAGFSTWSVKPYPGDLSWAKGQVPTPHGPISVNWSINSNGWFVLSVSAPVDTTGTVSLPVGFGTKAKRDTALEILVDGVTAWNNGPVAFDAELDSSDGYVSLVLTGGSTHDITVKV